MNSLTKEKWLSASDLIRVNPLNDIQLTFISVHANLRNPCRIFGTYASTIIR